jgi:hypothetical protein
MEFCKKKVQTPNTYFIEKIINLVAHIAEAERQNFGNLPNLLPT